MTERQTLELLNDHESFKSVDEFYALFLKVRDWTTEEVTTLCKNFLREQGLEEKFLILVNLKYEGDLMQLAYDLRCSGPFEAVRCFISYAQSEELYPDLNWPQLLKEHYYPHLEGNNPDNFQW